MSDPLTGLANRNQFNIKLNDAIRLSQRNNNQFALLQIDLDKFKPINDNYGHPFGDAYLKQVSSILMQSCREIDTVARIGGDEFSIIILDVDTKDEANKPVERILTAISQSILIDGIEVNIGLSIGISFFKKDAENAEDLVKKADEALYIAKNNPEVNYCYYDITG